VDTLMRMLEEKADVSEVTDHLLDIQRSLSAKADRAEKNKVREAAWGLTRSARCDMAESSGEDLCVVRVASCQAPCPSD
jgi:hypothetical protein